jgi:PAS domain S-box-containing protein
LGILLGGPSVKSLYRFLALSIWVIACLALFHIFYQNAKETAIAELNARQMIHAKQAAKGIEEFFNHWITLLESTALRDSIVSLNDEGKSQMAFILWNHEQGVKAIARVDERGRIIHRVPYDPKFIGTDISRRDHVRKVMQTHRPVLSGVFTLVQGTRGVVLHVPVFDAGQYRGSLGVEFDFEVISKTFLENIAVGETGYAWMIDQDGIELYCPVPGHMGKSVFENCKNFRTILAMAKEMLKGSQGTTTYLFNQIRGQVTEVVRKHAVYLPVKIADSFWSIVVATSEDEVIASLRGFRNRLLYLLAILLVGSLVFSFLAMRSWGIVRSEVKRRAAEKELRESEERFRSLFLSMNEGMALHEIHFDGEGRPVDYTLLDVNPAFESIIGIPRERAVGQRVSELYGTKEAPYLDVYARVVLTGEPTTFETTFAPLGKRLLISVFSPSRGHFATIFEDITERKRAEETIRHSEERFRSLYDGAPVGYHELDAEGRIVRINRRELEMLGYAAEEMLGQPVWRFIAEGDTEKRVKAKLAGELPPSRGVDCTCRRKDGTTVATLIDDVIVRDREGRITGIRSIVQDITERKRAEEALRESEAFIHAVLESLPIGVAVNSVDPIVHFEYMNDNFPRIYRTTREKLTAPDAFWDAVYEDPEFKEKIKRKVLDDCATGDPARMVWTDIPITRKGGGTRFISAANIPLPDRPLMISMVWDVTDRKRAEEEKEKLQMQLLQAQKMESVGRLAGGVAHDFNNILGIIIGQAELASLRVDAGGPVHRGLQEILKASQRSADIVRQLLAFARKQTISPKVLDLNETVQGMIRMLRRLIGEDIKLCWVPGNNLWPVRMDATQINQILANLVVNSRDAIDGVGTITLETDNAVFDEVYCQKFDGVVPGEYVLLAVTDTGSGMDPGIMENLFDPFFTTKELGKGTGLGLATVYGIVKQNNGFIDVFSEPGQGTTFKIYIPRHASEETGGQEEEAPAGPLTGTETILMVEDEEELLEIFRVRLEGMGYQVMAARSPGEALSLVENHPGEIHLLLTDVVMPEMNGRELMEKLRFLRPAMRCVFMSGYTANVIAHRGVLDEGISFLQKPFSSTELAKKVREVLDRS